MCVQRELSSNQGQIPCFLLLKAILILILILLDFQSSSWFTWKLCPTESKTEYEIGTLAYFLSGSLPAAGGAKSLVRLFVFGVVKAPISLLETFSKWIAAAWIRESEDPSQKIQQNNAFLYHLIPKGMEKGGANTRSSEKNLSIQRRHGSRRINTATLYTGNKQTWCVPEILFKLHRSLSAFLAVIQLYFW